MKNNFLKDISSSTIQVILNQGLGLLIFILVSRYLAKDAYGEFNWSLAILTFITTILSLRLEQIVVRKVAAGDDPSKMLTLFMGHMIFTGLVFYLVLLGLNILFPSFFVRHNLLMILAVSQLLVFFSSPFKQIANGKEQFAWLAVMSSVSNLVRSAWLLWGVLFSVLTIKDVLIIYIISALAELIIGIFIVRYGLQTRINTRWSIGDYFALLHESLPQIGSVFLNACIARVDWILLGVFSTTISTAEYSFAYKVYELSPVPLFILSPILLSRFAGYFKIRGESSLVERKREMSFLIRFEMVAATFFPLILNVVWTPLVDALTHNKYGAVNKTTFLLLSLCIPLQYMINLLWTIHFAQNRLALIFKVNAVTCFVIIAGDLLAIPLLDAKGAAIVYLSAITIEYILYLRLSLLSGIRDAWQALVICTGIAVSCGFMVEYITAPLFVKLFLALAVYGFLLLITHQIKKDDFSMIKEWMLKKQPALI